LSLDLGNKPVPDSRQLTHSILNRDRRWVRILTGMTIFFWVLATGGIVGMVWFYFLQIHPRLGAYSAGRANPQRDVDAWIMVSEWTAWSILGWMVVMFLAALSTVLLVLWSRRATLRQINANLILISEQLKQLQGISPSR